MDKETKKAIDGIVKENNQILKKFDDNLEKLPSLMLDTVKEMYEGKYLKSKITSSNTIIYQINSINGIEVNKCWRHYPSRQWSFEVKAICDIYNKDTKGILFGLLIAKKNVEHSFFIDIDMVMQNADMHAIIDETELTSMTISENSPLLKDMAGETIYNNEKVSFIDDKGMIINKGVVTDFDIDTGKFTVTIYKCCAENEIYHLFGNQLKCND